MGFFIFMSNFGSWLKDLREENKLSLRSLSHKLNVSHVYLHKIEKGDKKPSIDFLSNLSKELNLDEDFVHSKANSISKDVYSNIVSLMESISVLDDEKKERIYNKISYILETEGINNKMIKTIKPRDKWLPEKLTKENKDIWPKINEPYKKKGVIPLTPYNEHIIPMTPYSDNVIPLTVGNLDELGVIPLTIEED